MWRRPAPFAMPRSRVLVYPLVAGAVRRAWPPLSCARLTTVGAPHRGAIGPLRRCDGQEGHQDHQAPDPGRPGQPGPARWAGAGTARRQHHGVLQGVQRPDAGAERGPDHAGRDQRVRGPLVHVHHEDPARRRPDQGGPQPGQGLGRAQPGQGRHAEPGPAAPDRRDEDARPKRERRRRGDAHRRGYGAVDGRGGGERMAGRAYTQARERIDRERTYAPLGAVRAMKGLQTAKFDETVEVHLRLGVNVRHADQQLRGTLFLPHGTGRAVTVAVFAQGEKAKEAEDAGADFVGGDDLASRVQEGFTEFDVAIATPDMMGTVGRLGRILGPQGKMPSPKAGTSPRTAATRRAWRGRIADETGVRVSWFPVARRRLHSAPTDSRVRARDRRGLTEAQTAHPTEAGTSARLPAACVRLTADDTDEPRR